MPLPITLDLKNLLSEYANAENAAAMQKYMKSEMPYRGVKAPTIERITTGLFKRHTVRSFDEYEATVRDLWDSAEFREERYVAISFARKYLTHQTLDALPLYRMMIETGAWWDYVDTIAQHLIGELLRRFPAEMKPEMRRWIKDEHLWIRRSAILSQNHFKSKTDEAMLFEFCLECMDEKVFWTQKAIGWALREYSKTNPKSVREFVEANKAGMSSVTLKEAEKYV